MGNNDLIFSDDAWSSTGGGKILVYAGEYLKDDLSRDAVRKLVREKGALGARWTYDYDCGEEGPWYRYVCDTVDYDIDKIQSKTARKCVRRGLKNGTVRQVDYLWLADNGYEVYINAASRYVNFVPVSREKFTEQMHAHSHEPGREAFGVFVDEKLVAYATLLICGRIVRLYASKFDPAYSKQYPMYALHYTIAHHYLNQEGYKEIDSGSRALLHETDISDFLLRLGWRRAYCRLGIYLVLPVRVVLWLARIFRKVCKLLLPGRHYAMLESLLLAQDIAKATSKH